MARTKVGIVIAARNNGSFLEATITSALRQTVPCDVAYVDDCSSDDSLTIARRFEPRGLRVLALNPHAGVAEARNLGAQAVDGEYITFLDGDDMMPPDYVAKHLAAMRPGTPFVYGAAGAFGEFSTHWTCPEWDDYDVWTTNTVNTSSLWARWAFQGSGRWRDGAKTMWDWDIAIRGQRLGKPRRSLAVLAYRQHPGSWSHGNQERMDSAVAKIKTTVRRMNARLAIGAITNGRLPGLAAEWSDCLARAVHLIDTPHKPRLVILDNGTDPAYTRKLSDALDRHRNTFGGISIVPHPGTFAWRDEPHRRDTVARFLAGAYTRLRSLMASDIHWLVEDDILVPHTGGSELFEALIGGLQPLHAAAGVYRNRHLPTTFVGGHFHGDVAVELTEIPKEPFLADYTGTGCLMHWTDRTPAFWESHERGVVPAHDWAWCRRLKEQGGLLMMYPGVMCRHANTETSFV